jgi:hypothetical protein
MISSTLHSVISQKTDLLRFIIVATTNQEENINMGRKIGGIMVRSIKWLFN